MQWIAIAKRRLAAIWLIFAALFLVLSGFHFYWATQGAPDFVVATRPLSRAGSVQILGADVDQPLREFADSFNTYVHQQNDASQGQNLLSGIGYILASVTAAISWLLERASSRQ